MKKQITVDDIFGEEKVKKVEDFMQKHKEEVLHDYGWCKGNIILPEETLEDGVNWQKERSYTEEEVEDLIYKVCGTVARLQGITLNGNHINTAYEQFKKK